MDHVRHARRPATGQSPPVPARSQRPDAVADLRCPKPDHSSPTRCVRRVVDRTSRAARWPRPVQILPLQRGAGADRKPVARRHQEVNSSTIKPSLRGKNYVGATSGWRKWKGVRDNLKKSLQTTEVGSLPACKKGISAQLTVGVRGQIDWVGGRDVVDAQIMKWNFDGQGAKINWVPKYRRQWGVSGAGFRVAAYGKADIKVQYYFTITD